MHQGNVIDMEKYYLGIDQGTTGTRALLFNRKWRVVGSGYQTLPILYPQPGWVEHDPADIWNSVLSAVGQAMKQADAEADSIICIGIDHEGESVIMWDSQTGMPVYNCIVWQDRRNAREYDSIAIENNALIHKKTGLMLSTYFSATKYNWILTHIPQAAAMAAQNRLLAGTIDSWLMWKMTHGRIHATDASTASRTLLYNINEGKWDEELASIFSIDTKILPEIMDSAQFFAYTDPLDFLGIKAPITAVLVDQQAAMLGQACTTPGAIKTTYGTGCFMMLNTGSRKIDSKYGLLPTVAWKINGNTSYAMDGGVYTTGAAIKWLVDKVGILSLPEESEKMALRVPDNGGVYFVSAFHGLAAPYWDQYASGMVIGITGNTQKEHLVRAALEGTAFQVFDVLQAMAGDSDLSIHTMRCNGAATKNKFLMQFQADLLGISLEIPVISETTALGTAFAAALGIGEYKSVRDIESFWEVAQVYEPAIKEEERNYLIYNWHRAVKRAKYWVEE